MKTIKERAFEVVRAMKSTQRATIEEGEKAAWDLLQEIANAPEPNPSMWQIFGDDWSTETTFLAVAEYYRNEGCKVVAYYTAPPAPSSEKGQS